MYKSFFLYENTYFDTICVHPIKSAYTLSKMLTVKLTDKLEFVALCFITEKFSSQSFL